MTPSLDYVGDSRGEGVMEVLAFAQGRGWLSPVDDSVASTVVSVVEARAGVVGPAEDIAVSLPDDKVVVFEQRPGGYLLRAVFSCSPPAG
jgi:hypothetical protein